MVLALQSRPRRNARILVKQVAGKAVLLNPDDGQYFALDAIGGRVWDLCDGSHTIAAMVEAICQHYDTDAPTAAADLLELLGELADEHLVVEVDESAGGAAATAEPG